MITLDEMWQETHTTLGASIKKVGKRNRINVVNVNDSYNKYRNSLLSLGSEDARDSALNKYINDRKKLHHEVLENQLDSWQDVIEGTDNKDLWAKIDWKGNYF